jgi:hypothetical protein
MAQLRELSLGREQGPRHQDGAAADVVNALVNPTDDAVGALHGSSDSGRLRSLRQAPASAGGADRCSDSGPQTASACGCRNQRAAATSYNRSKHPLAAPTRSWNPRWGAPDKRMCEEQLGCGESREIRYHLFLPAHVNWVSGVYVQIRAFRITWHAHPFVASLITLSVACPSL